VIIGGTLIALGLLVLTVGVVNFPSTTPYSNSNADEVTDLGPNAPWTIEVFAPVASSVSASLTVTITANATVTAYIVATQPSSDCPPATTTTPRYPCVVWGGGPGTQLLAPLQNATQYPYIIWVVDPGPHTVSFHVAYSEGFVLKGGLPLWQATVITAAGAVLTGIGGLATFLGLFLKGNPYTAPRELPPESGPEGSDRDRPSEESSTDEPKKDGSTEGEPEAEQDPSVWDPRKS
jgi:hypothetical protein